MPVSCSFLNRVLFDEQASFSYDCIAIGAMNVKIAWQGQGIGKMMMEYMYREYGLEKDMVIVQTTASAEGFYQKLGWKTVDSTDIDLSEWAGKGLGYGLLRCPQMVRYA